ncbi:MAG TPA: YcaO-like family protein [Candidatus Omnitrophota bacterium]|nr:YcaO-like family protein [Candidatus Omnitrophota bacterium]HPT39187.1 YcaO-like family protein [Candidatus Omnitrophota bacterium]
MKMIKDCFKKFNGHQLGKVISPGQTCAKVLKKLQKISPGIYSHNVFIKGLTGIPQYKILGTKYFQKIVGIIGSNGKGQTQEQALASGLMELVERYSCFKYLRDQYRISSWSALYNNPFKVDDFYSQFLDQRIQLDRQSLFSAKMRWFEARTLEGEKAYLPMNLINFVLQGTNGMAAGNAFEEALLQAICEVIERHCLTVIEHEKLKTPLIKQNTICSPIANELIKRFCFTGYPLLIKDFSLDLGLPVVGVINRISKNECNITAGVAAHREEALIRALTENSQSLGLGAQNMRKFSSCSHYFDNPRAVSFQELPCVNHNNIRLEIEAISKLLVKRQMKVFYVDMTDKILNIPAVQVYITGAKFYKKERIHRNSLIALFNESFCIGRLKEAQSYLCRGINLKDRKRGVYLYFMGLFLKNKLQFKKAKQYLLMALNTRRLDQEIKRESLAQLGFCFENLQDTDSAISVYVKLLDLNKETGQQNAEKPGRPLRDLFKNKFLGAKNLYPEIRIARRRSLNMGQRLFIDKFIIYQKKRSAIIKLLNKALKRFDDGQYLSSICQVKKAIAADCFVNKIYNVNLFLAHCFFAVGQPEKAIKELVKAKKMDPGNDKINFMLAGYYRNIGQNKKYLKESNKGFRKVRSFFRIGGAK